LDRDRDPIAVLLLIAYTLAFLIDEPLGATPRRK